MAMVGKRALTQSMVDEEFFSSYGPEVRDRLNPDQVKRIRRAILDTMINEEAIYQKALTDTMIKVEPQEVAQRVEEQIKRIRGQFADPAALQMELRQVGYRDLEEYRASQLEEVRRGLYIARYLATLRDKGTIKPLPPTEREVRATYDTALALGQIPEASASINFQQVVIAPKPTAEAMARARQLVDSLIGLLRGGADFQALARQYSMDPGTRDRGGDLLWHRAGAGDFVREFEDAAFRLKPGQISEPVQTSYGLHIIQVSRVQGNEAHIYHILIIPEMDSTAAATARATAEKVRVALLAGANIDSIQNQLHDPAEERGTEGTPFPFTQLQPFYAPIASLKPGEISPILVMGDPGSGNYSKYGVVRVIAQYPAGPIPFEAIRDQIRQQLEQQYGQAAWVKNLLRETYVQIYDQ